MNSPYAAAAASAAQARANRYAAAAAQSQVAYQNRLGRCRTQCAHRPVLWQEHCRRLCMQGVMMPRVANETPWPPVMSGLGAEVSTADTLQPWWTLIGLAALGTVIYFSFKPGFR